MEDLLNITTILAALTTIIGFVVSQFWNIRVKFLDVFKKIYEKTFSARKQLILYNQDFHFELDTILTDKETEEKLLDILTELTDMFFYALNPILKKTFENLCSVSLYKRLLIMYSYIIYKRQENKNPLMFKIYERALRKMAKMKKINDQINIKTKKCWIGIRDSDVDLNYKYFYNRICLFSEESNAELFKGRPNQNIDKGYFFPYYKEKILSYLVENPDAQLMFYNQCIYYNFDKEIQKHAICINEKEILSILSHKLTMKKWFSNQNLPIIPFETLQGKEIEFNNLCNQYKKHKSFVIQEVKGGGGVGTFRMTEHNYDIVKNLLLPIRSYIVSPYIDNNVPVNLHVFIGEKQSIISPASIQIIEERNCQLSYRGADFIAFRDIDKNTRECVRQLAIKIANALRECGYKGVAGIDFIIDEHKNIYCMEINPRFQGSSILLDLFMRHSSHKKDPLNAACSTAELNQMIFEGVAITTLNYYDEINYSCYYYYNDGMPLSYYREKYDLLSLSAMSTDSDGFESCGDSMIRPASYLFRAVFGHKIVQISPEMAPWINDNIVVCQKPNTSLDLKIALLNQGIRFKQNVLEHNINIKNGVYNAVDITLQTIHGEIPVNSPCESNMSQYSPFLVCESDSRLGLYYYDEFVGYITIEEDLFKDYCETEKKILYLSTDRLRIKMIKGCEFKNFALGCHFCNVPACTKKFSHMEIIHAMDHLKADENVSFRHILIGGGTDLSPESWENIIKLCQYLKHDHYYKNKPLSLMTIPPPENILLALKQAGVNEVAFNIEICNSLKAQMIMPGKAQYTFEGYLSILKRAVDIFGEGNVRSALLIGIDRRDDIIKTIYSLLKIGVLPCLSAFRTLPGSDMEETLNPSNNYLKSIYCQCLHLIKQYGGNIQDLGPACKECRNNNLTL